MARRKRHRFHSHEKQAQHLLPATIRDRKENQSTFTITYYVPDPHLITSCAFTLDSSPVLLTPLSFSDWEKKKVSMRGLNKMLYKCQPLISTQLIPCTQPALQTARGLPLPTGSKLWNSQLCLSQRHFLYPQTRSGNWDCFICNIQTVSCSPGRPLLAAKLAGKEIFQKKRICLNTLENSEKRMEKRSAPHGSERLSIQILNGMWKGETVFRITWSKKRSFIIFLVQLTLSRNTCFPLFETYPWIFSNFLIWLVFFFFFWTSLGKYLRLNTWDF